MQLKKNIHTLIKCNQKVFIIFENGSIVRLSSAINNRKDLELTDIIDIRNEYIKDIITTYVDNETYFGFLVADKITEDLKMVLTILDENEKCEIRKINIKREGFTLSGYIFGKVYERENIKLYSLCKYC